MRSTSSVLRRFATAAALTAIVVRLTQSGCELDLDRNAERQLCKPDRRTCVTACVAEHFDEEIRASVDDRRHLVEAGRNVHHPEHLDDPIDSVEVSQLRLKRRENRQRGEFRGLAPLVECEIAADLSPDDFRSGYRSVAADVHGAVVDHAPEVVGGRREHRWQHDAERRKPLRDHDEAYAGIRASNSSVPSAGDGAILESVSEENQALYAQRLANALNEGVLQDAVEAGLEEQGPFTVDVLSVLDTLVSVGLRLVLDDQGDL